MRQSCRQPKEHFHHPSKPINHRPTCPPPPSAQAITTIRAGFIREKGRNRWETGKKEKQQGKPGKKRHKYQFFPPKVASFAKRNVALHKHAFKAVTIHVPHIAHIRVCHTRDVQQPVPVYFPARQAPVHHVHAHTDARPHLPQEIPPVGFHKNTKKSGSPVCLLQEHLVGM